MTNASSSINLTQSQSNTATVFFQPYSNYTLEKDVAGWLFSRKRYNVTPNMTVLPVLAIICFIVLVLLKVYNWYKENERLKTRGDVEFGDESEVNYGIIKAGDKEFCHVEIRSDTTSVYDTVTSFRHFGNGHVGNATGAYNCHDSVTSYQSLLMQRLDGTQYDSVKSYKAFLKHVTQNTDLAVEVKLLENYPFRSKSAEHCVLEEESSGISEATRPLAVSDVKIILEGKKKPRHRRASGDPIGAMRKRSASNPTYHCSRPGAASLPSIRRSLSSDSSNEDETFTTVAADRRRLWEARKRMARSCSGGKLAKNSPSQSQLEEGSTETPHRYTRRRHYSADSARYFRKPLCSFNRAELKDLRESISETDPRAEEASLLKKQEDSSSENPDSAPTSCGSSVSSDAIESESEDESTQQVTQMSVASDDHTVSCEGMFDSCIELVSSAEHLCDSLKCSNESVNDICLLPQEIVEENGNNIPLSPVNLSSSNKSKSDIDDKTSVDSQTPTSSSPAIENENHSSLSASQDIVSHVQINTQNHSLPQPSSSVPPSNSQMVTALPSSSSTSLSETAVDKSENENSESPNASNPRRVRRFHVTFVSSDVSPPNSE